MKKADAQKAMDNGTLVGYKATNYLPTDPVKIVGLDKTRRVYSGARWDMGGHAAHDGVEIEFTKGSRAGKREIVGSRTLSDLDESLAVEAEQARRAQEMQARIDKQRDDAAAAVRAINAAYGADVATLHALHRGEQGRISGWTVTVSPVAAVKLAEAYAWAEAVV